MIGYNVQSAVDTDTHIIVAHEVTNQGFGRERLSPMAIAAREALGRDDLHAIADKGYFSGTEILACREAGITTTVARPASSGNAAKGMYVKADFTYDAECDVYVCPAGKVLIYRYTREGTRPSGPAILDQPMPDLSPPEPMQQRHGTADQTVGARGSGRFRPAKAQS